MESTFILIASIPVVLIWLALTVWFSPGRRGKVVEFAPNSDFNRTLEQARWYQNVNFGALLMTPLWLFANGFWLFAFFYILLSATIPVLSIPVSILLFFYGTELSWAQGERWGNDVERFLDSQYFWNLVGVAVFGLFLFLVIQT